MQLYINNNCDKYVLTFDNILSNISYKIILMNDLNSNNCLNLILITITITIII